MKKRKKKKELNPKRKTATLDGALKHSPFKTLGSTTDQTEKESTSQPVQPQTDPVPEDRTKSDEETLYEQAMAGVMPMSTDRKLADITSKPRPRLADQDEESLVMRKLDELVHGEMPFDFSDTDEYIEAATSGLDRRLVRKLRRGEYAYQAHLDLHGFNREQARKMLGEFIRKCLKDGKNCVLIVHGRGIGSKDNIPVLKNKLAAWLTRGAIGRKVLAFTSARPYDGGTGAVYVLLRR